MNTRFYYRADQPGDESRRQGGIRLAVCYELTNDDPGCAGFFQAGFMASRTAGCLAA